ncbi:hypothetical protein [Falsibacillus pallidus]|uniref:hypothetical protein n=1 Tax=Falsibacillus pallidus TaxID=493781 RepID=UPI003D991B6A
MIKLYSFAISMLVFSLIFFFMPFRWNRNVKLIIFGLSLLLFGAAYMMLLYLTWVYTLLLTILLVLAVGLLAGNRLDMQAAEEEGTIIGEKITGQPSLPVPYFSFSEQIKKAEAFINESDISIGLKVEKEKSEELLDLPLIAVAETAAVEDDSLIGISDTQEEMAIEEELQYIIDEISPRDEMDDLHSSQPENVLPGLTLTNDDFDEDIEEIYKNRFSLIEDHEPSPPEPEPFSKERQDTPFEEVVGGDVEYEDLMIYLDEKRRESLD